VLTVRSGGGSGYGPVAEREHPLVHRDVREDRVTPEQARTMYGVAVTRTEVVEAAGT
jgi:N-methylhydantoinase B